jgi:hypothetical protein
MSSGRRERIEPLAERRLRLYGGLRDELAIARDEIDAVFGAGFALKNPALLAAALQSNALYTQAEGLDERLLWLGEALEALAVAVEQLNGKLE